MLKVVLRQGGINNINLNHFNIMSRTILVNTFLYFIIKNKCLLNRNSNAASI